MSNITITRIIRIRNRETPQSEIRNPKSILIIDDSEDDILLTKMVLTKISGRSTQNPL